MNQRSFDVLILILVIIILGSFVILQMSGVFAAEEDEPKNSGGICLPGLHGMDCALTWLIAILLFFLAALFRKNIANDLLNMPFSLIGASILGEVSYLISLLIFKSIKFGALLGLAGVLVGGFLLQFFGDTESDGGGVD